MRRFAIVPMLLASTLAGCRDSGGDRLLVGVTLLNKQDVFYQDLEAGMREAAGAAGLDLLVQSAEKDLSAQTAQIENFIVRGVDAVVVCPVDSRGVAQVMRRAADQGVAVFTADIAADGVDVVAHVASDNVQGGRLAGEFLAARIGSGGVVAVVDHPEVTSVQDRVAGFLEAAERAGLVLAARPSAQGRRDMALDVSTTLLQAHPEIRGIFAINDETALGVLQGLRSLDREGDVVVVGYDAIPEAREAIASGTALEADVVQHPREMGRRVVAAVADHLAGRPVESLQAIPVSLVTRETLQSEAAGEP